MSEFPDFLNLLINFPGANLIVFETRVYVSGRFTFKNAITPTNPTMPTINTTRRKIPKAAPPLIPLALVHERFS